MLAFPEPVPAYENSHNNYLIKEILEQPAVIEACLAARLDQANKTFLFPELDNLPVPEFIRIIGCGTSANAGLWGSTSLENIAEIPVHLDVASESRYLATNYLPNEVVIAISQSGESSDTLAAVKDAKAAGKHIIVITNTPSSKLTQLGNTVIINQAGPEMAIPATKSMLAQMLSVYMMSIYWALRKGVLARTAHDYLFEELPELAENLRLSLPAMQSTARAMALKYRKYRHFLFAGRGINYPLTLEGALKFKEITYIHAEGISLGAIPHGARALLDEKVPVFALALSDQHLSKTLQDLNELRKQGCKIIALVNPGQTPSADDVWSLPVMYGALSSFLALPAMQLFAYEVGMALNRSVDAPRTLSKAVTEKME